MGFVARTDLDAVKAMRNLIQGLGDTMQALNQAAAELKTAFDENKSGLGPHAADIKKLLEDMGDETDSASVPVKKLVLKLTRAIAIRISIIEQNRYGSQSKGRSR